MASAGTLFLTFSRLNTLHEVPKFIFANLHIIDLGEYFNTMRS